MPTYIITGKNKHTGRKRTRYYDARTIEQAKALAEAEGTDAESISQLPPEPPSDRQLAFAKDLGLILPAEVSKAEVSDIISRKLDEDSPPDAKYLHFAEFYNINFTQYTGKKEISYRVFKVLNNDGKEKELAAWFVYHVYLHLCKNMSSPTIQGPDDPGIQKIAVLLANDSSAVKSIRRYEGKSLFSFGEHLAEDQDGIHSIGGASKQTIAYKQASESIRKEGLIAQYSAPRVTRCDSQSNMPRQVRSPLANQPEMPKKYGCIFLIIIFIAGLFVLNT